MILINKTQPLSELTALQQEAVDNGLDADSAFEKLRNPLKKQVLQQLLREQGHLCAYCMRRIPDERGLPHNKIEHWKARNGDDLTCGAYGALDYYNMLAVCTGNEPDKTKPHFLTCDACRGNKPLTVNPTDEATLVTIYYTADGMSHAKDPVIDTDLVSTLNLNCNIDAVQLPSSRKAVLDTLDNKIVRLLEKPDELIILCKKLLSDYEADSDEKQPFVGIILWRLRSIMLKAQDFAPNHS